MFIFPHNTLSAERKVWNGPTDTGRPNQILVFELPGELVCCRVCSFLSLPVCALSAYSQKIMVYFIVLQNSTSGRLTVPTVNTDNIITKVGESDTS